MKAKVNEKLVKSHYNYNVKPLTYNLFICYISTYIKGYVMLVKTSLYNPFWFHFHHFTFLSCVLHFIVLNK